MFWAALPTICTVRLPLRMVGYADSVSSTTGTMKALDATSMLNLKLPNEATRPPNPLAA
jgi:hypothetical protein